MRKIIAKQKRPDGCLKDNKVVVGLVGTHRGTGTTHTALLLASFTRSILGDDTSVIELNAHKDMEQMEWTLYGEIKGELCYEYRKIDFYKGVRERELPELLYGGHTYHIMDFGASLEQHWREFVRCDKKIVICSPVEWKSMELNRFLQRYKSLYGIHSWNYLIPFGNERMKKWIKKEWNIQTDIISYEPNPFTPSENSILLFRKIMNG